MSSEENIENNEILGCLEELGLSKYESSVYYSLVGRGMASAADIAYCSDVPRTKIYSVLKKLEKKKLVSISYQKPLTFRAVSPNDAFNEIITSYDNRLKGLKKIISTLQQINDEGLKKKGIEEKEYFVLNQFSTYNKIKEMINNSKISIDITINPWGNKILDFCKEEIMGAICRDVKIRIIFDKKNHQESMFLTNAIQKKCSRVSNNIFNFDNYSMLILDNSGTGSVLIQSDEIFITSLMNQFKDMWEDSNLEVVEGNRLNSLNY